MQDKDDVENIQSEKLAEYEFTISPDSEMSFDFAFRVPREGGPGTRIKYRLYATADIAGAIDPSKTIELAVTDAAPIAAGAGDVPQLLQTVATLRRQGGDHAAEIEAMLRQVIALDGRNAQALRQLAEVVGWRNDAEAVPLWHAYLQVVPADVEALGGARAQRRAPRRQHRGAPDLRPRTHARAAEQRHPRPARPRARGARPDRRRDRRLRGRQPRRQPGRRLRDLAREAAREAGPRAGGRGRAVRDRRALRDLPARRRADRARRARRPPARGAADRARARAVPRRRAAGPRAPRQAPVQARRVRPLARGRRPRALPQQRLAVGRGRT